MSNRLTFQCPALAVTITAPRQWSAMRGRQLDLPLSAARRGMGIIDTGAERTVIRADICEALGLPRLESVPLRGVTAPGQALGPQPVAAIHRARITVCDRVFIVDAIAADVADDVAVALIGMDIIGQGRLVIDGPNRTFRFEVAPAPVRHPQARIQPARAARVAIPRRRRR